MDNYKEIRELLKPRRDITASAELRHNVRRALDRGKKSLVSRTWLLGGISLSSAVAAILLIVFLPSGISAKEVLSEAIEAFSHTENIDMIVEIRTRPIENFRYMDINADFVSHHICIAKSDSAMQWRIDKGERLATGNGRDIHTWIPSLKLGFHLQDTDNENVLGYLANLLSPWEILNSEFDNCVRNRGAEYHINKTGTDIILTVYAAAQGNFDNIYLLNSSITESENVRRYVIDADTKRLKSATVSVMSGKREIVVLKMTSINYDYQDNAICRLPDGVKFVETEDQPAGLKGLSAEEAASTVLSAFADWNTTILDKVIMHEVSDVAYKEQFRGSSLISIGKSFTSGSGNSIFVPYTLELRDGSLHRHNIALQKTDSDGWIVVGGL